MVPSLLSNAASLGPSLRRWLNRISSPAENLPTPKPDIESSAGSMQGVRVNAAGETIPGKGSSPENLESEEKRVQAHSPER
ncbi:hypothetical protein M407DRAFT_34134 [Tulasnella calospora MUT 4182]|uniref:Uncharacterized protein n=1 Tax=Tulasnella calospora MUT 4182 TaxID=1051891 RepID=A0A0C3K454_9AGAM|nr:hypothetical protein M407DRAFT_34134 [Tulasnella calospora MUT 4182]